MGLEWLIFFIILDWYNNITQSMSYVHFPSFKSQSDTLGFQHPESLILESNVGPTNKTQQPSDVMMWFNASQRANIIKTRVQKTPDCIFKY
jgi:hypothetical protein